MHRNVLRRGIALVGMSALFGVIGIAVAAAPAQADPVCVGATVSGTATGTQNVGPYCRPYPWGVLCMETYAGLSPTARVDTYVCLPII